MTRIHAPWQPGLCRLPLSVVACFALGAAVLAQGHGHGGGTPSLHSPVIITYSNVNGSHAPPDITHWYTTGAATTQHPDQLETNGRNRELIHSVSPLGDLTHGGGERWVLDVRLDGPVPAWPQFNALIATPETVASESNPTWWYVPAEDDGVDVVLLDASVYEVVRAQWATQVSGGVLKVAFWGTGPSGGSSVTGLWVGRVTWSDGPASALEDITLVSEEALGNGLSDWKWGTANQLVFTVPDGLGGRAIVVADVSGIPGSPPTLAATGIQGDVSSPALSRSGAQVAFVDNTGSDAIYVVDLGTSQTVALNTGNVTPLKTPEWSPNDAEIVFVGGTIGSSGAVYKTSSSGTGGSKKLTNSKVVGNYLTLVVWGPVIWRE